MRRRRGMKDQGVGRARTAKNGVTAVTAGGEAAVTETRTAIAITDSIVGHRSATAGSVFSANTITGTVGD
jgi:hypothetical protein